MTSDVCGHHLANDLLDGWPDGCWMIARRDVPHPGAQLTFTDVDGHRYQVFVADLADTDIAYLEALYRGRCRAERQIRDTKALGLESAWVSIPPLGGHLV